MSRVTTPEFDPVVAAKRRDTMQSAAQTREQRRNERQGRRLAGYAIHMANRGYLDMAIPAKQFRLQPWSGVWFEIDFEDEAYAHAASIVAESGLRLTHRRADVIHRDPINEYEYLIELSHLGEGESGAEAAQPESFARRVVNTIRDLVE